ncbi:hypothetical protein [Paenibacillus sp. HB172176]|uniref:tetratricopeptide repeat protein n=1 Tax=Paenibacillus sp. HB172176 TaxID=2493690 RepID=UPI0014391D0D|nr:hypothetical protein [Paenibacillus sp. HB172176]
MLKFGILFLILNRLLGNPILAIIVVLVLLYVLDRRFVGLTPSILKPLKKGKRIRALKDQIENSPNLVSAKQELARLLIERKKFKEALKLLEPLQEVLEDSAEFWDDLGHCCWKLGDRDRGNRFMLRALELNPRVKYGEPYLRLAVMHAQKDKELALTYLSAFQELQSSSCEAYYRLADIYKSMQREQEAKAAAEEGLRMYRSLPRYRKRAERGWALRLLLRK